LPAFWQLEDSFDVVDMAVKKTIVCFANSRKLSGRCIAGKDEHGAWVRPVSIREHEEVSENERQYADGSDPKVLDVMRVPLLQPKANAFQPENWLLDPECYWELSRRLAWAEVESYIDPVAPLWGRGHHSYNGLNDRLPVDGLTTTGSSLRLIRVDSLTLRVFAPGLTFGNTKRRVQGQFRHDGAPYRLWVTDPAYEREFLSKPNGNYELEKSLLTVSLGEPYDGYYYILIAAIIRPGDAE
jgi:Dual OB-containing domain